MSAAYQEKMDILISRFEKESGKSINENHQEYVRWLIFQKNRWVSSTWRIYKGASIYYFKNLLKTHSNAGIPDTLRKLKLERSDRGVILCKKKSNARDKGESSNPRTSNNKFKSISSANKKKIFYELDKRANRAKSAGTREIALLAKLWISASIIVGVRPQEWSESKLIGDASSYKEPESPESVLRLVVKNSKYKEGGSRTFGAERTLIMTELNQQDMESVVDFYVLLNKVVAQRTGGFSKVYESVRGVLWSANSKAFSASQKYITLYSARHQFVSNRKAMGEHPIILAALLGHASVQTAMETYGLRRVGKRGYSKVNPSSEDVDKVIKNTSEETIAKINKSMEIGIGSMPTLNN